MASNKNHRSTNTLKFLCSYGGKILPRYPDGQLRYVGGETRVLGADRSVKFAELLVKFGELCGSSVSLRCQLPNVDLDALVSVTSDEDLAMLIGEYDRASRVAMTPLKIRAFLSIPKSVGKEKILPHSPPSTASSVFDSSKYVSGGVRSCRTSLIRCAAASQCVIPTSTPIPYPHCFEKSAGSKLHCHACVVQGNPRHMCLAHNRNYLAMPPILPQYRRSPFTV